MQSKQSEISEILETLYTGLMLTLQKFFSLFLILSTLNSYAALEVGINSVEITPQKPLPLAGYGEADRRILPWDFFGRSPYTTFLKPSKGILDPIRVKTMTLDNGRDNLLIFLSFDFVGMELDLYKAIESKLAKVLRRKFTLIATATHTHSGPGGLSKKRFWQLLATDRFLPWYYQEVLDKTVASIIKSLSEKKPASIHYQKFETQGLTRSRSHVNHEVDSNAHIFLIKDTHQAVLGGLVNFAIHGIALDTDNYLFSSDIPGGIERELERHFSTNYQKTTFMLINGAEGDVSPSKYGQEGILEIGKEFKTQMLSHEKSTVLEPRWSETSQLVRFKEKPKLTLSRCMKNWWIRPFKVYFGGMIPREYAIRLLKFGHLFIAQWPGEPVTQLALQLKRAFPEQEILTFALSNAHFGYFVTNEQWDAAEYESCLTLTGRSAGGQIQQGLKQLIQAQLKH